jgi:hypothetical protein
VGAGLFLLLAVAVVAQNADVDDGEANASFVAIEPVTLAVRQQAPVSVTFRLPLGPTGTQTVTVPMLLDLNIQLSLAELVSPSIILAANVAALTPTVAVPAVTLTTVPPTPTVVRPTSTATPAVATAVPTATASPITSTLIPTTTPAITATAEPGAGVVLLPECTDPRTLIVFPGVNQAISGTVDVLGTAVHESFDYYKLEYALGADADDAASEFFYLGGGDSPVEGGTLARFNTRTLANGPYTLRLTVVDQTGNFPTPCQVTMQVEN